MGVARWQPKWWTEQHGSAWDRVKDALKRDWEQTKNDLHMGGRDLDQDVGDTVKQATGKDMIPPPSQANAIGGTSAHGGGTLTWDDAEQPLAYGYGAHSQYGSQYSQWDDRLENQLRTDWESGAGASGGGTGGGVTRKWNDVKNLVRRGFEHARH